MTFEEWVAKQPLQVRRDLYEYGWIRHLCSEAWMTSDKQAFKEGYLQGVKEVWDNRTTTREAIEKLNDL